MLPTSSSRIAHHLRWTAFRALEAISDLKGNEAAGQLELRLPPSPKPAQWVFASTIGELNAVEPLLRVLCERTQHLQLVLISDHAHYRESYLSRYPDAEFCVTRGHSRDAGVLSRHYPPRALFIAEIPCFPADAPCRFSSAFLFAAKRAGASIAIINGWLYHYEPACTLDTLERKLLSLSYLNTIDTICVQTPEVADTLTRHGAAKDKIHIVGNLKFDAIQQRQWSPADSQCPALLTGLLESRRPVVVAGCMTDSREIERVVLAFVQLRELLPQALLIIAHRHPEVPENMVAIETLLTSHGLPHVFRSNTKDEELPPYLASLVLDTMGELRDFYAIATVAHVGVDHNLLEPLLQGKSVTTSSGWDSTYPSYPVYRLLNQHAAIHELEDADGLTRSWYRAIQDPAAPNTNNETILKDLRGSTARHVLALNTILNSLAN